ncbi:MAG: hypothetical protein COV43_06515 [Deltaproteobacteria bacterium CG11_big_fil_rev_8_21_14_0_20_42_23]|nr:MAG: hypothetical protein COV43_06515 [Deltaproteobacteria bacterium CG11_big_fil_rev_8_21_14_0_20_42_23]PJC64841.1 MAG: hypothetical protein CO021_02155 [Deltaproteobacteria bacterium CG_4_9_14_0_2_um_filter_42_21]
MSVKWIQSLLGNKPSAESLQQGSVEKTLREKIEKTNGVDVPHEVLTQEAAEHYAALEGLKAAGSGSDKRERLKKKVRKKVWDVVTQDFDIEDEQVIEEITERMCEFAESDPDCAKMFEE